MTITAYDDKADAATAYSPAMEKATITHVEGVEDKARDRTDELAVGERHEKLNFLTVFLSMTAAVSGLCFGYDTGVISAALVSMEHDLGKTLTHVESEWIATATSCGALVGALTSGYLADRIGRKYVLGIGDVWFVLGAVIICSGFSVAQVVVGRVVLGLGVGTAAGIAPLYIAELAPTRFRGAMVAIQCVAITGGQFISYCIGVPFTGSQGWRIQFGIGIAPALVQAAMIHYLPESPRYDVLKGRSDRAAATIRKIYPDASDDYRAVKLAALEEVVEVSLNSEVARASFLGKWRLVATRGIYRRPAITALGIGVAQQLCGFNSLMYYAATIFKMAGFDNPTSVGLIVSGTNWFFGMVCMFIMDRVGKRRILLCTYPFMIAGLALAAIAFWKMTEGTGLRLVDGVTYPAKWSNMMLGMMVVFIASYALGTGNITWTLPEIFPLELRGMGASILAGGVWAANIVISATFLTLMNAIGPAPTFGLYAGICLVSLVFIFFCYPETSGLSLEELQEVYRHGFGVAESKRIRHAHKDAEARRGSVAV